MIKAVIFDLDGVILDTEKLYMRFWLEAAHKYGYDMKPEHVLGIRSMATKYASVKLKKEVDSNFDIDKVKSLRIKLMSDYVDKNGVDKKSGADEILDFLNSRNIPVAIATATPLERAELYLKKTGIYDKFNKIICAYMVEHGKPEPDVYIEAARQLGFCPQDCMAVEDSPNGIISAYRAGCKTVMIPDQTQPDKEIADYLYAKCDNLKALISIIEKA